LGKVANDQEGVVAMFRPLVAFVVLAFGSPCVRDAVAQSADDGERRFAALEARLRDASEEISAIKKEMEEVAAVLRARVTRASDLDVPATAPASSGDSDSEGEFRTQILGASRDFAERGQRITAKPELLLQGRFSTFPEPEASPDDYPSNFRIARLETRWAGRIAARFGAGVELQYHPAPDGAPDRLVNDAFIDFYATPGLTIRGGQFVKPFGFDVQQRNAERESPERAMFAGYIFPGERDRGVMAYGALDSVCTSCAGLTYYLAAVNGNRFFADSNRQLNFLFRLRKVHHSIAYGSSVQLGTQITPPGVTQTNDENAFGVDLQ
jgi:hypothetical protein